MRPKGDILMSVLRHLGLGFSVAILGFSATIVLANSKSQTTYNVIDVQSKTTYDHKSMKPQTIFKSSSFNVKILSFVKEQKLAAHHTKKDAFLYVTKGDITVTIAKARYQLKTAQAIKLPANIDHSLIANRNTTVMLVKPN